MPLSPRGCWFMRVFVVAVLCLTCGTLASAQKQTAKTDAKLDPAVPAQAMAQQQEIQSLVHVADAAMSGQPAPADFPIQLQNDFLKAQATRVWVPIILTLDPAKTPSGALTLYLRVTPRGTTAPPAPAPASDKNDKNDKNKDKKKDQKAAMTSAPAPNYPYEDVSFLDLKAAPGQPLRVQRGIGVPAGSYDLYIVLHERAATATPAAGSAAVPPAAAGKSEHPYAFGQTEIIVSPDHKFKKSQELIVLLQIYNPMVTPEKKFNLEANYTFYRQDAGTEKRFNGTEPQTFSSETMGAGFDPSGNSSIQAGQGVPLQSFPDGSYRLEIKITDKLSSKVLTQNVSFTVAP